MNPFLHHVPQAAAAGVLLLAAQGAPAPPDLDGSFATITAADVSAHLAVLAAPELEGRDSPSAGLTRAGDYLIGELKEAGFEGVPSKDVFRHPFWRRFPIPDEQACSLSIQREGGETTELALGTDFVPLPLCKGEATGSAVFVGFGIAGKRYNDLKKKGKLKGAIAVILEGEPRHKRLFEGPVITKAASAYTKIGDLAEKGVVGVLLIRREPPEPSQGPDGALGPAKLAYRYTWASWPGVPMPTPRGIKLPVLEIGYETANKIFGKDVQALAKEMDKSGKSQRLEAKDVTISLASSFRTDSAQIDNVVGLLPGTDPALKDEYVVLGAHYDHIGVDWWGRIGYGADDNGSGTSAVLEMAQAFAAAPPRRSVLVCFFAAEEDGLHGSRAIANDPPVPSDKIVAMINLDMVGRGNEGEVVVLGTKQNPELMDVLKEAKKLKPTKVKKITTGKATHLWGRSDHISFHSVGVPVLFFFEAVSETLNPDYHTFRDTIEGVNLEKITRTARFAFNTAWLIANDDDRPPPPRGE